MTNFQAEGKDIYGTFTLPYNMNPSSRFLQPRAEYLLHWTTICIYYFTCSIKNYDRCSVITLKFHFIKAYRNPL